MKTGRSGDMTLAALLAIAGLSSPVSAQDAPPADEAAATATEAQSPVTATEQSPATSEAEIVIPKLTPVVIEILEPLGSKLSTSLQTYRIALHEPIVVDGVELVPAGLTGMGEVVHAKKAGGMGAAGELVLAARYLDFGDRQIKLRSMALVDPQQGKDRTGTANAFNTAGAATVLPVALIGFMIGGGNIDIPAGTLATAKLAADFAVARPQPAAPAAEPVGTEAEPRNPVPDGDASDKTEGNQ